MAGAVCKAGWLPEKIVNVAAIQIVLGTLTFFTFVMAARSGLTSCEKSERVTEERN